MAGARFKHDSILTNISGNIGISAALVLPLVVLSLGLGVDYGYLTLQKREMQGIADITAMVAASDLPNVEDVARNHFKNNGLDLAIATKSGLIDVDGKVIPNDLTAIKNGIVTIVKGRYVPDPSLATGQRFIANATPADAAQVSIEKEGTLHLAAMFSAPPTMSAVGTAASTKLAAFSIGSRLASLDGGILNAVLGQMLGTTISLKVMDYQALVSADINIQPFLKIVSTKLSLTAASYDDVLKANLTMPQLLASMQAVQGVSSAATSALKALETASSKNKKTFTLSQILNLDPKKGLSVDAGSNWAMKVSALDIVTAAAGIANGTNQISLAAVAGLPGIASASVKLAIGEPPVTTPAHRLGAPGSAVRTAQTRLAIEVSIDGLAVLAGLRIKLPIYVEIAYAEGKLADIRCYGGSNTNASVSIDAVPGVAEIAIGTVNPTVLSNFSDEARVEKARLVDSALLKIDGIAHVETKNMQPQRLTFSPSEVAASAVKSVSTKDILTSTTQTLLNNLDVDIQVLFLTLGSPKVVQAALAQTLGAVTPAIDTLLYNVLLAVGVRVGEADVRVTGVNCLQPVLVQ
ncbi:pilus assembly protein TadG-related protein [Rhizobium herbae]|uniref:Membrane protein n=1 Tax=Rhizobium herbae TaxID=508661 RepID=A0ABS4EGJ6_9HYPH|nr:pilus assembly protein TadG-related protein [Rhizobium herbae]MBP1857066.1 putative membrane protein [Rhizobium herbae]